MSTNHEPAGPSALAASQCEAFRRDGYLCPLKVMEPAEAAGLLASLERLEQQRAGRLPPYANGKPHLLLPWLWDLVHDPRVVERVAALLGPDLLCYGSSFIDKRPADGRYVAWHQDATYWGLSSPEAVTAWIALSPSTPQSGCVRVLPGSHREVLAHAHGGDPRNLLGRREKLVEAVDESRAADLVLQPGEMSLHHPLIVHGSNPNTSTQRRCGFAVRYIPAHLRVVRGERHFATLVRGRDHGNFDLEVPPTGEFDPAAVARHREAFRSTMSVIFDGARAQAAAAEGGSDGR